MAAKGKLGPRDLVCLAPVSVQVMRILYTTMMYGVHCLALLVQCLSQSLADPEHKQCKQHQAPQSSLPNLKCKMSLERSSTSMISCFKVILTFSIMTVIRYGVRQSTMMMTMMLMMMMMMITIVIRYGVRQSTTTAAKYEGTWANGLQVIFHSSLY